MIIVTGGAGFIGSAFLWSLNERGIDDLLVVDALDTTDKWKNLVRRRFRDYVDRKEFLERMLSDRLPGDIDAVVHMGACSATTERDAAYLMENNTRFTRLLSEWALRHGARFVYASSGATYGDGSAGYRDDEATTRGLVPLNMYGYSKHLFDLWALQSGALQRMAGLKFFNVFGPNEYHKGDMRSVVHKAFEQIRDEGRVRLFKSHRPDYRDGEQVRDFVYVKDVVAVMLWLLEHREVNGLFNVGTGRARTWKDLATAVFTSMDRPVRIDYIDMPETLRDRYQYHTQADVSTLVAAGCPVTFRSLETGVTDYVQNYLLKPDPYL